MNKNAADFWQFRAIFAQIFAFWDFPDLQGGCHDVFIGHGNLKKQKYVQKLLENTIEIQ